MSVSEMVSLEKKLTPAEADTYSGLLAKPSFAKSDFSVLETFYGAPYEKLTEFGKGQLSKRTFRGTMKPDQRQASIENDKRGTMLLTIIHDHQRNSLAALENAAAPKANADTLRPLLVSSLRLDGDNIDLSGLDDAKKDALFYAHAIKASLKSRFDQIRKQASADQSEEVEKVVASMLDTLLVAAQSEYQTGLYADFIERKH